MYAAGCGCVHIRMEIEIIRTKILSVGKMAVLVNETRKISYGRSEASLSGGMHFL